jgi:predicted O-linked N-acetylglucosamine transferase (SPINDLY family)
MLKWFKRKVPASSNDKPLSMPASSGGLVSAPPPEPLSALLLFRGGRLAAAEEAARLRLEQNPQDPEGLLVQGLCALQRRKNADGLRILEQAALVHPSDCEIHVALGQAKLAMGRKVAAVAAFEQVLVMAPGHPSASYQLAMLALAKGREDDALRLLRTAVTNEPSWVDAQYQFGNMLRSRGELYEAERHYRLALAAQADHVETLVNLGGLLKDSGRYAEAVQCFEHALQLRPELTQPAFNLAMIRVNQRMWDEASRWLQHALAVNPKQADVQYWLGNTLMGSGDAVAACMAYQAALRLNANYVQARWGYTMAQLPAVPASAGEQGLAVAAFDRELSKLCAWFKVHRPSDAYKAVGAQQPYYLAYIPGNHRSVLSQYGGLCASQMGAWARKMGVPAPSRNKTSKCKVGIVSAHVHEHSVWRTIVRGWIDHLDPAKYEIHIFHTGSGRDGQTDWAVRRVARFYQAEGGWHQWVKTISEAHLDVLVYPEIGMDATTVRLASLRLASFQLASWGHPITTGLPTIDFFVSAQGLEPEGANAHYTEKLLKLPNLGCCYSPLGLSPERIDLSEWGIDAKDRILLCAGTPFKYAPADDMLWVEIAKRCGPCKLVFFCPESGLLGKLLEKRMRTSFQEVGMHFDNHVRFIPWLSPAAFFGVLDRADVYLDTVGFSGFNTAMQAVERGTPIVAWDGEFLRGRFASGILRQMGLHEWIASSSEHYVALVEKLCADKALRLEVKNKMLACRSQVFDDRAAAVAFGSALTAIVGA